MKGITLAGFFTLILFLVGCGNGVASTVDLDSAIKTLTATMFTPTFTSTPDPDENALVLLFNRTFQEIVDPLSQTVEATYKVDNVTYLPDPSMKLTTLLVEVHCECTRNTPCCTTEHTLVLLIQAIKTKPDKFHEIIPSSISQLQVSCYDHEKAIGVVSLPWQPILEYATGKINGYQLGGQINKNLSIP